MDVMLRKEMTWGGGGGGCSTQGHGSLFAIARVKCHWLLANHANEMQISETVLKGEWVSH